MQESIWSMDTQMPEFPSLQQNLKTDVLIIGGGLAGILCAHQLAADGVSYTLIEADQILCGVSRNTTAKITSQHGLIYDKLLRRFGAEKARQYYDANEAALAEYRSLAKTICCDFEKKSNYIYALHSRMKLEQEMRALEKLRIPADFVEDLELPISTAGAVRFQKQAQFHPLKLAGAMAKGLKIYENTRALEFIGNQVRTPGGTITAEKIIVTTHYPMLNKHGNYFLKLYQQRSYVLALAKGAQLNGMYLDEAEEGLSFRNQGELLLLGGGGHRTGKHSSGWRTLEAFAQQHCPGARAVTRWATQDCVSLDGVPYIGRYSRTTPNLFVAAGFNKWGMTSAMVSAMVLCDLVQGRENPYADLFSPSRNMLRPQLAINGWEAAVNLLTPTVPRCPHMGCALKWNPQEHSWDCPCHGSRFSREGKLLDNPATDDAKPSRD